MPLPGARVRSSAFSADHGSACGVKPNSAKLAVAPLSFGKNWLLGDERKVVRIHTCVIIDAAAWHTFSR